jgi:AcrR family transcriptional regulator
MTVPTLSLKERQRHERERLILQAAQDVLTEQGYDATSMEDIANKVGISRAAIYLHFPSKEDLVFALLQHGIQHYAECLEETFAGLASPREKVRAIIQLSYGGMAQPSFQFFNTIMQSHTFFSKFAEKRLTMREVWNPIQRQITNLLEEGKRNGDFDPTMPTPLMASLLSGLLTPFTFKAMVEREQMPVEDVIDALTRYFLKGIAPDRSGGAASWSAEPAFANFADRIDN